MAALFGKSGEALSSCGRIDQAIKVENELRNLLSEADADYRDSIAVREPALAVSARSEARDSV
jgi:hypothetical protein